MDHRFAQVFGTSFAATVPHRNLVRRTVVLDHDRCKATIYVIGFYRSDLHTLLIRRFRSSVSTQLS